MRKISTDILYRDIDEAVRQQHSDLLAACQSDLDEATREAEAMRSGLRQREREKEECEKQLNEQLSIVNRCRQQSKTHAERQKAAEYEYLRAQERLKYVEHRHAAVIEEKARIGQRYDTLALSAPQDRSNYDAQLAAYRAQVENLDNEIKQLTSEIETLKRSGQRSSSEELINALYLQVMKLRGDKAALPIPVEDGALKAERSKHFDHMEGVRAELVSLEQEVDDWRKAENEALSDLEAIEKRLHDLQDEPERNRIHELAAHDKIDSLREKLNGFPTAPSASEISAALNEESAAEALKEVEDQVANQIEAAKIRFESSDLVRSGDWKSFSQLVSNRAEAERLWGESVEEELAQIESEIAPDLAQVREHAEYMELKFADRMLDVPAGLTPEEERVLSTTFTPEEITFLQRGGELKVWTTKGFRSWAFYLNIGLVVAMLIVCILMENGRFESDEFTQEMVGVAAAITVLTAVVIRLFRLKGTVRMKYRLWPEERYIDVPYTADNFRKFREAQTKKSELERQLQKRNELISARREESILSEKLNSYIGENFPQSARTAPLKDSQNLRQNVECWYEETLEASLGKTDFPAVKLEMLRPSIGGSDNEHVTRTLNRWESKLKKHGWTEFTRQTLN